MSATIKDAPRALVVMALPLESQGVFEQAGVPILYCGVGKVNAAIALTRELSRYAEAGRAPPMIVNFGTAGSPRHAAGEMLACREFVQRDMDVRGLGFALGVTPYDEMPARLSFEAVFTHLPEATCGSGDSFATAGSDLPCEVVDMEAYALAKACKIAGARFGCVKYVTDGADHAAAADWLSNVHKAAAEFLHLFLGLDHQLRSMGDRE